MNFAVGDILEKNSTTWISENIVNIVCNVPEHHLRTVCRNRYKSSVQPCHRHHKVLPDTGKSWRWAVIKGKFYYALDNIPNRKPTYYRDQFGDREELIKSYNEAIKDKSLSLLESHFLHYKREISKVYYQAYLDCTKVQQVDLSIAAALLEGAAAWMSDHDINASKSQFFKDYTTLLEKYDIRYLPKNYRKFKEKVLKIVHDDYAIVDMVYLPRQFNSNAQIHIDDEVKSWAIQLRSMGENYSNDWIIRKVKELCGMTSKSMPSRRWFGQNIFEKHHIKFLTAPNRFGQGERGSRMYEGYIPMKNALFAGDCWHVDATRLQIISHKTEKNTQKHLFVIAVRDVYSGDILGYNFDYKEDRWSVISAVKMAVQESGYLPYQIVFDRFPGHNTEEAKRLFDSLEQMGVKVTITHNAKGKAKLERWFGTLQSVFMPDSKYYYGEGIKSKRLHAHRSPEYLRVIRNEAKKEKFGLQDAYMEGRLIIEAFRRTPYAKYSRKHKAINKCPDNLHIESDKPHVKFIKDWQISMLFGLKKKKKVSNLGLISTEIQGAEYHFKIEQYEIFSKEPEVILSYDLEDLSRVYVFKKKHHFLVYLCEAKEFDPPQTYGPQAEFNRISIEKTRIKEINKRRKEELDELTQNADEVALMMGRFTQKDEATEAESIIMNGYEYTFTDNIAVGSDVHSDHEDNDITDDVRNQY